MKHIFYNRNSGNDTLHAVRRAAVVPFQWSIALVLSIFSGSTFAQNWTQTGAPANNDWQSLALSADGATVIAAGHGVGPIYFSTNSGTNWSATGAPAGLWTALASSADGNKLLAVGSDYQYLTNGTTVHTLATTSWVYTSANAGVSWTKAHGPPANVTWTGAATSADGNKLTVASSSGAIYTSANAGVTWTLRVAPNRQWNALASSADGTRLVAVAPTGGIYTSANSGATWMPTDAPNGLWWWSVACSADGRRLVAAANFNAQATAGGPIFLSTNSGANWRLTSAPSNNWVSVSASADASTIVAVANGGICLSKDAGTTWATTNPPSANSAWQCVATTADGNKVFAGVNFGGIHAAQMAATPWLNMAAPGNVISITWIIPSMRFVLQESEGLGTANWTDVATLPTVTNYQKQVTLVPQSGNHYYRLKAN